MKSKQQLLLNFIRVFFVLIAIGVYNLKAQNQSPQAGSNIPFYQGLLQDEDGDNIPDKTATDNLFFCGDSLFPAFGYQGLNLIDTQLYDMKRKFKLTDINGRDIWTTKFYYDTSRGMSNFFLPLGNINAPNGRDQIAYFDKVPIPSNIGVYNFWVQRILESLTAPGTFYLSPWIHIGQINTANRYSQIKASAITHNTCGSDSVTFSHTYTPNVELGLDGVTNTGIAYFSTQLIFVDYGDDGTMDYEWVMYRNGGVYSFLPPVKYYTAGTHTVAIYFNTPCGLKKELLTFTIYDELQLSIENYSPVICQGGEATLTAVGNHPINSAILWSNGSNNSSITVNTPGTYSVIAGVGGCYDTAYTTVSLAAANECCMNSDAQLNVPQQQALTFNNAININTLRNVVSAVTSSSYFANASEINNFPFDIVFNGNLVVDEDFAIKNCPNFKFGKNGGIIISANQKLSIQNSTLTTCGNYQWRGISGSKANLSIESSNILYADTAVSSTAPAKLMVNNSVFSNCYVGIRVAEVFDINKLTITNNHFSSSGLKLPYPTNQKGLKGIDGQLLMAGAVNNNHFEQLNNGIYITASSLNLKDNLFKDIQPYNSPCAVTRLIGTPIKACPDPNYYGVAIVNHGVDLAFVNNTVYRQFTVNIDNSNNVATDYSFDNCQTGVFSLATHLDIANTRLKDGLKGFIVQNSYKKTISIGNNQLENVGYGIALLQNKYGTIKIADNTVTMYANAYSIAPLLGRMGGYYGIRANDWPGMPATYAISNNFTYNGRFGIKLENLQGYNQITYNTCNIDLGTIGANYVNNTNLAQYGIYIENCKKQEITNNTIRGGADDMVYDNNRRKTGIFTTASNSNTLACNTLENLGYSMHVQGDNSTTWVAHNDFNGMRIGVYYNKLGTYSKLGDQGFEWGTGAAVFDNMFTNGTVGLAHTYRQTTLSDTTKPDKYFFSSTLNSGRPTINLSNISGTNCKLLKVEDLPNLNPQNITVPYCAQQGSGHKTVVTTDEENTPTELSEKEQIAEAMVVYPEFEEVVKWIEERKLYREISEDTTLADESIILDEFYNETTNAVMGKLEALKRGEKEISDAPLIDYDAYKQRLEQLKIANEQLISQENHELREKQINELFYTTLAKEYTTLSAEQEQLIADLANGCPLIDGEAVYLARAMYAVLEPTAHFDSKTICNNQGYYKTAHANGDEDVVAGEIDNTYCALYPNPAHQQTAVNFILQPEDRLTVKVFDALGRLVSTQSSNSNVGSMPIATDKLANGNYFVKAISLQGKEFGYKLVVSH